MVPEDVTPDTLLGAIKYFADVETAIGFVAALRWPDGVICPRCDATGVCYRLSTRPLWKCRACKKQFSVKVGSIFEDSPIGLDKWLPAMWMLVNCKNGVSSYEIARDLGVTQKTAWFMLHRLRLAVQTKSFEKIGGSVEIDETYIGGKARNMHKGKRARVIHGTGGMGKVAVMGLLERHGRDGHSTIRTEIVSNTKRQALQSNVRAHVEVGAAIYTDALRSYRGLDAEYVHGVIDHAEAYVDGHIHTNGCENFWSLLKRALKGTYVSVEPFHLFRYLDEQSYRFNNRKASDGYRFLQAMASVFDKRLTFAALTGKHLPETC
ncbi:MAG: IS1595 family transposase [Pyrinomonadaceae bacterium]|nr:IS1595 family transposase [Pyrinomonadaceae bacterium]